MLQVENPRISERTDLNNTFARKWVYFLIAGPNEHVFKQSVRVFLLKDIIIVPGPALHGVMSFLSFVDQHFCLVIENVVR